MNIIKIKESEKIFRYQLLIRKLLSVLPAFSKQQFYVSGYPLNNAQEITAEFIILRNDKLSVEEYKNRLLQTTIVAYEILWENVDKYLYFDEKYIIEDKMELIAGMKLNSANRPYFDQILKFVQPIKIKYFYPPLVNETYIEYKKEKTFDLMNFDSEADSTKYYTITAAIEISKELQEKNLFKNIMFLSIDSVWCNFFVLKNINYDV